MHRILRLHIRERSLVYALLSSVRISSPGGAMPGPLRRGVFVGALALLIACAAWTAPEASRVRASIVVIEVSEPIALFGKTYPGGRLSLRPVGVESPGVTLHSVSLDGNMIGVLPAHRRTRAGERTEATGLFGRDGKG